MKRPPKPLDRYDGHADYPSTPNPLLSRRAFLRGTTAVSAGAMLTGLSARAVAVKPGADKRQRVTIYLSRGSQIGKSGLRANKLDVFTSDKKLARFLGKYNEKNRIQQALSKQLRKVKAETLYDGKKLYRLERTLGGIVAKQYKKRTGRTIGQPDVMLSITRYYRFRRLGGVMVRPHRPRKPVIRPRRKP